MKTLIKILCLSVLWFSCENSTEPEPAEIDVDWVLVKTLNMPLSDYYSYFAPLMNNIGYYFYLTSDSNITNLNLEEECAITDTFGDCIVYRIILNNTNGFLSFTYNGEEFNFDVSDSYNLAYDLDGNLLGDFYLIHSQLNEPLQRILYNQEMNYFTLFEPDEFSDNPLNASSPNELIDYR